MLLLKIFYNLIYTLLYFAFLAIFIAFNTYLIINLPGSDGYACIIGANINLANISFALILSILSSLLVVNMIVLFQLPRSCRVGRKKGLIASSSIGITTGTLTIFCPVCSIGLLSFFGFSLSLAFISEYNLYLQIFSLTVIIISLYLIKKQLDRTT